jgi:hypothetical protein
VRGTSRAIVSTDYLNVRQLKFPMQAMIDRFSPQFEWSQPSLRFAISDIRRNWARWLIWSTLFTAAEAALAVIVPANPRHERADPRWFFPGVFVFCWALQFFIALCMWRVRVTDSQIIVGQGRGTRRYRFKKIARVCFNLAVKPYSFLVSLNSGKEIEIFIDDRRVPPQKLVEYLRSSGVSVVEGFE